MRGRSWTSKEEEKLIELWKNTTHSYKQIGDELGRSLDSVECRIRSLRKIGILDYRNPKKIKNKYEKDLSNVIKLTPSGAYFITSVLGDGHVRKRNVFIFRKRDCIEFRNIICQILNITPLLNINWRKARRKKPNHKLSYDGEFQISSIELVRLLVKKYGIPIGKKSGIVRIPRQFGLKRSQNTRGSNACCL